MSRSLAALLAVMAAYVLIALAGWWIEPPARVEQRLAVRAATLQKPLTLALAQFPAEDAAYSLALAAQQLGSQGDWHTARLALEQAVALRPDYAEAWAFLGYTRLLMRDDGYVEMQRALDLDPQSLAAHLFLALYWERQGDFAQSQSYLQSAQGLAPDNLVIVAERARMYARQGNLGGGRDLLLASAEANPRLSQAWRNLAEYCLVHNEQIKETGLAAARAALLINPADPRNLNLMGQLYLRLNDPAGAGRFFERALAADANHPGALLGAGTALLLMGDEAQAAVLLQRLIDRAPDSGEAQQAARLLNRP